MYQYISKLLLQRGFFEVNGNISKYLGPVEYRIYEDEGIISVERDFNGSSDDKNEVLDHIQELSLRYALTGANIRGGKLRVYLTRPGEDAEEEAIRIDFLTQSIESGIREIMGDPMQSPHVDEEPALIKNTQPVLGEEFVDDPHSANQADSYEDQDLGDIDDSNHFDGPADNEWDTAPLYMQEEVQSRARSHYIPPDENPNVPGYQEPFKVYVIDRRFSLAGFIGAVLGGILGAVLMGVVRVMDVPAQYVGFLIPVMVILIYRIMAGRQMPILLGSIMVLGSLLLGSVLVSAIDILGSQSVGILDALKGGVQSHFDNDNYYVFNVWLRYGTSVLIAAIPTILLLTGGKKREIVY